MAGRPLNQPRHTVRRILPLALALLIGVAAGRVSGAVLAAEQPYAALDVFARVLTQITDAYVEPISQRDLVYHALDGMDNALDAHSRFLDPESFRRLREESDGQFVGIGAQMRQEACGLGVTAVLPNGPAERAGIAAGDCIVSVDAIPLADLPLDAALATVRGQEGAGVTLGVSRDGVTHPIAVLRSRLVEASVNGALFAPGWAYLRIRQFRQGAAADLAAQVWALGATTPIRGAVLDLRDNPGGRLDEAIATVDLFLRDGRIVSTRGRSAQPDEIHDATGSRTDWDWPVIVLIDGQSASAAEIVAGALQDRARARLVGEASYGKGSVQSVFEYEDGSALKLTIARYHLPSGRPIEDHRGLVPDVRAPAPSTPGAAELLRDELSAARGLAPAERDKLLALADRLPTEPQRQPIDFTGTLEARLQRDPALALGWQLLRE